MSLIQNARSRCPELIDIVKEMDAFTYSHGYGKVFNDFVNWLVFQHQYPPSIDNPLKHYKENEQKHFLNMYQILQKEVRSRVILWNRDNSTKKTFYDPLGRLYEVIKTNHKSSLLGQYFTPEPIVEMMTQIINVESNRGEVIKILDPACGSGRMGLSSAVYVIQKGIPTWISMNDIDGLCAKMTAVNMALNGVVGEATCMNGLDITGDSYRFGYQVIPIYSQILKQQRELYRLAIIAQTGQDIKKQYGLIPIKYEETYLSKANKNMLERLKGAKAINDKIERKKAEEAIQNEIKTRLNGSLFENDTSLINDIKLPSNIRKKQHIPKNPKKANKKTNNNGGQGSLF